MPRRACLPAAVMALAPVAVAALQCPDMPKQASRDAEVEVRVGVRQLGDAKSPELEVRTRQLTTDLLGKVARADRVYLEQMLFAAYCSAVRDNAALGEGEREARVLAYRREMRQVLAGGSTAAADPRDKARAELARLPVDYTAEAFHHAIREGDLKVVRLFIAAGIDLDIRNRHQWHPLQAALIHGQWAVADALIDAGAPPTGGALAQLAAKGDLVRMRRLLALRPAREAIDDAFELAASNGQLGALQLLMREGGADLNTLGSRAVHRIGIRSRDDAESLRGLEWLHARGVPIDNADGDGWTPMLQAAARGAVERVRAFVRLGANVNHRCECSGYGDGGLTALLLAAMEDNEPLLRVLLDGGARPVDVTARGRNPLHVLLERGTRGPAALLVLERGAPPDTPDADGVTPLMGAAQNGAPELVRALLARDARHDARTPDGRSPLSFAAVRNREDNAALLLDAGAAVEARTATGRTVLAVAVRNSAVDTVRLLLGRGARPDAADRDGLNPTDHARALPDGEPKRAILRLLETAAR
jgi:uncharacterized protein